MHPQLEAFVEVVRRGSVTAAARSLYVTQPALTARLNALERTVGSPLLVRRRGGVRLTEAGRAFLPYAERALQAIADGRTVLAELERRRPHRDLRLADRLDLRTAHDPQALL
jgi:DNA-binding transcriptional LysR family regulator